MSSVNFSYTHSDDEVLQRIERKIDMANATIAEIRAAFNELKANEEVEDANAATTLEGKNQELASKLTEIANLQQQIADLQAREVLTDDDKTELNALLNDMKTMLAPTVVPESTDGPTIE